MFDILRRLALLYGDYEVCVCEIIGCFSLLKKIV